MNTTSSMLDKLIAHIETRLTAPVVSLSRHRAGIYLRALNDDYMILYFRELILIGNYPCVYSSKDIKSKCDLYLSDPDLLNKLNILVDEFQSQC